VIGVYLFFDTETTGLPKDYKAPWSHTSNWPRIVTISWLVTDGAGRELRAEHSVIRPEGFVIPDESAKIHGVTHAIGLQTGVSFGPVLSRFLAEMRAAGAMVAHNYAFDAAVVAAELFRQGRPAAAMELERKIWLCTMRSSAEVCKLPGRYGDYKFPRLVELHRYLFECDFEGAHSSMADTRACAKCFFELRRRGLLGDYRPSERDPAPTRGPDPTVAVIEELLR
jgi:DNA polymerase III epsilon subunit-like protein